MKHPILSTLEPVLRDSRSVHLDLDRIEAVADWMAWEELGWPAFFIPVPPRASPEDVMDFIFLSASINFAFTDFETGEVFCVDDGGTKRSDSEAMLACLRRALDEGLPILDGGYLATIDRPAMEHIFRGSIPMPMLDERLAIFRQVGRTLSERYRGRFHNFVAAGPGRLYAGGEGLLERLTVEFPSFSDESALDGARVRFVKRAQLLFWMLATRFRADQTLVPADLHQLTAFADYILPVALRILGIFRYSADLEETIRQRRLIPAQSREEVEIRAQTVWAVHLLSEAVNQRRPEDRQVIAPVIDGRLWSHYHETSWPHHLTVTTAY